MNKSIIYFTKDISSQGLIKIYKKLNIELKGNVAVKISTGEPGGHNFLSPLLIKDLVSYLNGTIVECLTAYKDKRFDVESHLKAIEDHGFSSIAPCDIMDSEGEIELPIKNSKHLGGVNLVGKNIINYDSMLMLSHFKGHQMAGMGGALKNMSIGVSSKNGKAWIHSSGYTKDPDDVWNHVENQEGFLESMAEADSSVMDYFKGNIAYINVANKLSVDCDCASSPEEPRIADIGIFASLDPVALDKCCYDSIFGLKDENKSYLINRMESRNAIHLVEHAHTLGLGNIDYEIVNID